MTDTMTDQRTDQRTEYRCVHTAHPDRTHLHFTNGNNGAVTWTMNMDYVPPEGSGLRREPGRYRQDDSLPEYTPDDFWYRCSEDNHANLGTTPHRHFRAPGDDRITYSSSLDWVSEISERLPGVYVRDDSLPVYQPEPEQPGTAPPVPVGVERPRLAVSKRRAGDLFLVMEVPGDAHEMAVRPNASGWPLTSVNGPSPEQTAWLRHLASRYPADCSGYWVDKSEYEIIGNLDDPERLFREGGIEWAYSQVPHIIRGQAEDMRERVTQMLREQQKEQDWCDELDMWMERMGLDPKESKPGPEYMTFDVTVYGTTTVSWSATETITVEVDGDESYARERAEELAAEEIRGDIVGYVDVGHYRTIEGSTETEVDETDIDREWYSDEEGAEV